MLRRTALFLFFIFILTDGTFAQLNYVPNPSFEDTLACPYFVSQLDYANHWTTVKATPDLFHSCNNTSPVNTGWVGVPVNARGFQPARTGVCYAGIVSYYEAQADFREAFQAQLTQPLAAGVTYDVGMYVVLMEDYARWAIDGGIGIYISNTPITVSQYFTYTPQIMNPVGNVLNDSLNWTLISGSYTASGGEEYITIGGFLPDSMLTKFDRGSGSGYNFTTYAIEDVFVTPPLGTGLSADAEALISVNVYPNPCTDVVQVFISKTGEQTQVELFNVLGSCIYSKNTAGSGIGIPMEGFAKGLYYLKTRTGNQIITQKIVKE